ncbi:MAG: toll/interleukin-1 receptor domain-containing protein [bacterium]|nr:toll/interleukin-1 receptor domain-containing protein [bacterium]
MPNIFISYRRADSSAHVGRIYDRLVQAFGKQHVFKDVDNIPVGVDFRQVLAREVAKCDIVLVVIGRQWMDIRDDYGRRRIDNPDDFVRIEVASALARQDCLVVPVLLQNTLMPPPNYLPPDLQPITYKNAAIVRDDPDFHDDLTRLISGLGQAMSVQHIYSQPQGVMPVYPKRKRHWMRNLFLLMVLLVIGFVIVYTIAYQNQKNDYGYPSDNSSNSNQLQQPVVNYTTIDVDDFQSIPRDGLIVLVFYFHEYDSISGFYITIRTYDSNSNVIYESYVNKNAIDNPDAYVLYLDTPLPTARDNLYEVKVETVDNNGDVVDTDTDSFFYSP